MRSPSTLRFAALALAAALGTACTDRLPSEAGPGAEQPAARGQAGPLRLALRCTVQVASGALRCGAASSAAGDARAIIYGGQGTYVQLTSSNASYNSSTEIYQFDATVQNLLPQPIGTTDGTTLHASGVQVFFHQEPVATSGTGTITIANADGTGIFTAAGQPYYQYNEVLDPAETSAAKSWQFNVPATVVAFDFLVYVSTEVPYPNGYVDVTPSTLTIQNGLARQLTADVRDALGVAQSGETITWTSADTLVARVNEFGVVRAVGAGSTTISATSAGSGSGTRPNRTPASVTVTTTSLFAVLNAGRNFSCGATSAGATWCWGRNAMGNLGDSSGVNAKVPVAVLTPAEVTFTGVAAGGWHACGLTSGGYAYCWGQNNDGRLGSGDMNLHLAPVAVSHPSGVTFTSLVAGGEHSCALTSGGQAYCWGYNGQGQVGRGNTSFATTPAAVTHPSGVTFASVSAGDFHTCALDTTGKAWCWGSNSEGQVGDSTITNRNVPTAVKQGALSFVAVSAEINHSCALTSGGQAYCWGRNDNGQLGNNSTTDSRIPVAVQQPAGVTFVSINAGGEHTCARTLAGQAYCWGRNANGQLGDGTTTQRLTPVAVSQGAGVAYLDIAPDQTHTCALRDNGQTYCWGRNNFGQVGDNTLIDRSTPTLISF